MVHVLLFYNYRRNYTDAFLAALSVLTYLKSHFWTVASHLYFIVILISCTCFIRSKKLLTEPRGAL